MNEEDCEAKMSNENWTATDCGKYIDPQGDVRIRNAERQMNPRAWLVSKADMHGNLYDALAWDNGGKPLGVSVSTPVPMYDDAAIRELIVAIQSYREAIRRALEAWDTTTNSKSHDGRLWQCMEELRMEIEK